MQKVLKEKYKNFTPEPTNKLTKARIILDMKDKILKFSSAVYKKSTSPGQIQYLEKMNLRGDFKSQKEKSRTINLTPNLSNSPTRKFQYEGLQILNLPKLPYGQHANYKEKEFSKKHFIDMDTISSDLIELKDFNKVYRKQLKLSRKQKKHLRYHSEHMSNLEKYLICPSVGGSLHCEKEENVMESYETQKLKFQMQETFKDITQERKRLVKRATQKIPVDSLGEIQRILSIKDLKKSVSIYQTIS